MKLIEKILFTIFFLPAFIVCGLLYGLFIVPLDLLDQVIWSKKDE